MAGIWTAEIDDVTIVSDAAFELSWRKNFNDRDSVESVDYLCEIRGDVVAATPGAVASAFIALAALVKDGTTSVPVRIKLDGVTQFEWDPTEGFVGPHVVSFESVPDGGNANSHWKYAMTVVFRGKPESSDSDMYDFTTSFTRLKVNGRTVREVWRASGKAKDRAAAVAGVLAFKPATQEISEQITESATDSSAEAVWVWEALQPVICRVRKRGSIDYVSSGQAGANAPPVLHRLLDRARVIEISGTVRGYTPNLSAPTPHLTENENVSRVDARESNDEVAIESAEKGVYELNFHEVWLVSGPAPNINHNGNHHVIDLGTAPAPGAIIA